MLDQIAIRYTNRIVGRRTYHAILKQEHHRVTITWSDKTGYLRIRPKQPHDISSATICCLQIIASELWKEEVML